MLSFLGTLTVMPMLSNVDKLCSQTLPACLITFMPIMTQLQRPSLFLIIFLLMYVIFTEILYRNFYRVSSPAIFLLLLLRMIVAVTILLLSLKIITPV